MRLLFILLIIPALFSTGCKKKATASGGGITVSGTLGSGLNGSALFSPDDLVFAMNRVGSVLNLVSPSTVNGVVALPLYNGQMNVYAMSYAVTGSASVGGQMSISLSNTSDYVILLLDTTQSRKLDQVVGYLNLSDAGNGLMKIPTQSTATSSIEVGTITQASGSTSASSSQSLSDLTSAFTVNLDVLQELAKTDDILQTAKNIYANYTSSVQYAQTQPYFVFNGDQDDIIGEFNDPAEVTYSGYGIYLDMAYPGVTTTSVCAASGAKALSLTPPSTITSASDTYAGSSASNFTVLDNTGVSGLSFRSGEEYYCGGPNSLGAGAVYVHGVPSAENFGFNWGGGTGFAGAIAAGEWVLQVDGTEVGRFDLKAAAVVDSNGKPTIYVPVLKLDKDSNNIVTAISLKFYTWNGSGYVQVTDPTAFLAAASSFTMYVTDYGQSPRVEKSYSFTHSGSGLFTVTDFAGTAWKQLGYGAGTASYPAMTSIAISYNLYGANMRFDWRP